MSVTVKDVAKAVGVSPSTVSRVINGNTSISPKTRDRIMAAMAEMDYHPDSRARNLVNGGTGSIGLIMDAHDEDAFSNIFFDRSVFAIERFIQDNGYTLLISNDDSSGKASMAEKLVLEKKVDGLLLPSSIVRPGLVRLLQEREFPFVVLGEPNRMKEETCWVDTDNEEGGCRAVIHLVEQGYKELAFLVSSRENVFIHNRINGFKKGLIDSGKPFDDSMVIECRKPKDAEAIIRELFSQKIRPDAFLCANNMIAWHVLQVLKQEALCVPRDVGVVTFDNYPFAQYMDPPLTAIDVDTYGIGEQAARLLLQKIKRTDGMDQYTLPTKLLVRMSSQRKECCDENGGDQA